MPLDQVTSKNVVQVAMTKTLCTVGEILLNRKAILLPSIQEHFRSYAKDMIAAQSTENLPDVDAVTCRWILSHLIANLHHHVAYSCKVHMYGTLVYRPHTDLAPLLNEAMWRLQHAKESFTCEESSRSSPCTGAPPSVNTVNLDHMSNIVIAEVNKLLASDSQIPFEFADLHIDDVIKGIHPQLWNLICTLTRSTVE